MSKLELKYCAVELCPDNSDDYQGYATVRLKNLADLEALFFMECYESVIINKVQSIYPDPEHQVRQMDGDYGCVWELIPNMDKTLFPDIILFLKTLEDAFEQKLKGNCGNL